MMRTEAPDADSGLTPAEEGLFTEVVAKGIASKLGWRFVQQENDYMMVKRGGRVTLHLQPEGRFARAEGPIPPPPPEPAIRIERVGVSGITDDIRIDGITRVETSKISRSVSFYKEDGQSLMRISLGAKGALNIVTLRKPQEQA